MQCKYDRVKVCEYYLPSHNFLPPREAGFQLQTWRYVSWTSSRDHLISCVVHLGINFESSELITWTSSPFFLSVSALSTAFVGTCAASVEVCGTVRFSACSLGVQTNWALCADGDKRQAYGRGQEESGGSRSHVGKVESPADPAGTTTRKRNVRFTGLSVLLGNKEALTHNRAVQTLTHSMGKYWNSREMLLHFLLLLRRQDNAFHTQADSDLYSQSFTIKSSWADVLQVYNYSNMQKQSHNNSQILHDSGSRNDRQFSHIEIIYVS